MDRNTATIGLILSLIIAYLCFWHFFHILKKQKRQGDDDPKDDILSRDIGCGCIMLFFALCCLVELLQ